MPSFTAPPPAWPDPLRFALTLTLAFSFTLIAAWPGSLVQLGTALTLGLRF